MFANSSNKKRKQTESGPGVVFQRQSAVQIAETRLQNAGRSMELLYEREKHRLAFHKANEDLQAHIASLPPESRKTVEILERDLHIGLANPLPIPASSENVPTRPRTVTIEEKKAPKTKEKTPTQKIKAQENKLKVQLMKEKKKEGGESSPENVAKLEKELLTLKLQRQALQPKQDNPEMENSQ